MLKGLPAKQTQTRNIRFVQIIQYLFLRFFCKWLSVMKIPCLLVKTSFAVMRTSADKKRHTNALAIGHIAVFNICVIQIHQPSVQSIYLFRLHLRKARLKFRVCCSDTYPYHYIGKYHEPQANLRITFLAWVISLCNQVISGARKFLFI